MSEQTKKFDGADEDHVVPYQHLVHAAASAYAEYQGLHEPLLQHDNGRNVTRNEFCQAMEDHHSAIEGLWQVYEWHDEEPENR